MLKLYFVLVVIYFLFGYFFLPDSICSTGWYFLSAALFPVAFFIVIGLLAQKGIIKNSSQPGTEAESGAFPPHEQQDVNNQIDKKEQKKTDKLLLTYIDSENFDNRFLRARTEPLEIIEFYDESHMSAKIKNVENGHTYFTTEMMCECDDYKKHHKPCKHMLFLALQTMRFWRYEKPIPKESFLAKATIQGKFIPIYWEYYHKQPPGLGYTNLFLFSVCGRLKGVSKKTGRSTDRRKKIVVSATDSEDARKAAAEIGVLPPYQIKFIDTPPSYEQYRYLRGVGIPYPNLISSLDVSALLTRYEDQDDKFCSDSLFEMATQCRVRVSYFSSPDSVMSCIWSAATETKKIALFCYAVYCRECGYNFGCGNIKHTDSIFSVFSPTKKEQDYILSITEFGYTFGYDLSRLNRRLSSYQDAVAQMIEAGLYLPQQATKVKWVYQ